MFPFDVATDWSNPFYAQRNSLLRSSCRQERSRLQLVFRWYERQWSPFTDMFGQTEPIADRDPLALKQAEPIPSLIPLIGTRK
jgi:hypothetical protein